MRVFVVGTGRCGSLTFAEACRHIGNYTSAHESRNKAILRRLDYPDEHIEVDHRLVWFMAPLLYRYGEDGTVWVHLRRDRDATVESWCRRATVQGGMLPAFGAGILPHKEFPESRTKDIAALYVDTVTANVGEFLAHRRHVVECRIEDPHEPFDRLWDMIGATGDRSAAHETLGQRWNENL